MRGCPDNQKEDDALGIAKAGNRWLCPCLIFDHGKSSAETGKEPLPAR